MLLDLVLVTLSIIMRGLSVRDSQGDIGEESCQ
jgi:hypothetical protein